LRYIREADQPLQKILSAGNEVPVYCSLLAILVFAASLAATRLTAQDATSALESYFSGRQVLVKIDMPGTQKGVDLRFNKPSPMDWKEYGSRIKQFGPAIQKGDTARITSFVVKRDIIELQLDGGGFGTFGDDSNTTVTPKTIDKSDYEKELERQIANSTDDDQRRRLQRDLDRERSRRERQNAAYRRDAQIASQMKAQQVSGNRLRGGSRFNLRWSGSIPRTNSLPQRSCS
jgi:hypothetical protein